MKEKENILSERDFLISNILKAELILSDYTLTADEQEKAVCIELLNEYIDRLDHPKATFIFNQLAQVSDDQSKDIYIDILFDVLATIKAENDISLNAWTEKTVSDAIAI